MACMASGSISNMASREACMPLLLDEIYVMIAWQRPITNHIIDTLQTSK